MSEQLMKERLNRIHENIAWFMEMYFWYLDTKNKDMVPEPKLEWVFESVRFWLKEKKGLINVHKEEE